MFYGILSTSKITQNDGLDANNRWVKITEIIPWDFIDEQYAKNFSDEKGRPQSHHVLPLARSTSNDCRENRPFCKEQGIRLSGLILGRPRKDETDESSLQAYKDSCDRNMVESRNGIGKRRYGLDLIMAYLAETGKTEAVFIILSMNVAHLLCLLLSIFWHFLLKMRWPGKSSRTLQMAVVEAHENQ